MAEEEDKPGQDATIQVSGSELEVLRQSAQMIAVSRDALGPVQDHQPRDETTLDLELKSDAQPLASKDDDSTKAINRQSLVQIIKTEINASNPSGEAKPFGIMRRDDRAAPSLKRPSKAIIRELGDEHSDQTQAIDKEELKLLRQSQNIALDEISQAAASQTPAQEEPSWPAQPSEQALDETTLFQRADLEDELEDELHVERDDEPDEPDELTAKEAPRPSPKAPRPSAQAVAQADDHEPEPAQAPSRGPWMLLVALMLFLLGAALLFGLDVISI